MVDDHNGATEMSKLVHMEPERVPSMLHDHGALRSSAAASPMAVARRLVRSGLQLCPQAAERDSSSLRTHPEALELLVCSVALWRNYRLEGLAKSRYEAMLQWVWWQLS